MNRTAIYSATFLLGILPVLPSAAQEQAVPVPRVIAAAQGVPNLKQFPRISLTLPNETIPLELNIASQTEDGRFAGEATRLGAPPNIILGLIEATDTGGYMIEFTLQPKEGKSKLFQGSIFVAEAVGNNPRKVNLTGIYSQIDGETPVDGPFPFMGTGTAMEAPRNLVAEKAAARRAAELGVEAAPVGPTLNTLFRSRLLRLRDRGIAAPKVAPPQIAPQGVAPKGIAPQIAAPIRADRLRVSDRITLVPKNVMEALERRNNLKTFVSLVKLAGMEDAFRKVKLTVFAPEDAAFEKLPFGVLDGLRKNQASAKKYIGYCISYQHKYLTKPGEGGESLPTGVIDASTGRLGVSRSNGRLWLMGNDSRRAPVLEESVDAGLGALYVTGQVLILKSVRID